MIAKTELNYDVLLEAQKDDVDHYFKLLKEKGWFDFVDDFVLPEWGEEGVKIDRRTQTENTMLELNYPKTIRVDNIRCENTPNILGRLKHFHEIR
jgi:hypothetical protein